MLNQTLTEAPYMADAWSMEAGEKETPMHKRLVTFTLAILIVTPLIATAAGADRTPGSLPAAVDQLLARDMIQQAQTHLKLAGFDPGRADGVFDARTADAVRHYQAAQGLPVSGLLDESTRKVMFPGFHDTNES
jgi:peptidoglycan hydrolase-like protein with peptidoglycan-binding domain